MLKVSGITGVLLLLFAAMLEAQTAAGEGRKNDEASQSVTSSVNPSVSPEEAIRGALDAQVAAWNRGDLKGYMQGYWHSQELTFFAGSKESAGWEAAYERYRAAYVGRDKGMGKLKFANIRVEVLSPEAAFVRGGWQLTMKDGIQRSGLFTVVLKKFSEGWRIIHDHSS
jgi:ketosteroid isomerase-like protein